MIDGDGGTPTRPALVGYRPMLACRRGPHAVTAVLVPDRPAQQRPGVAPSPHDGGRAFRPLTVEVPGTPLAVGRIGPRTVVLFARGERLLAVARGRRAPFLDGFDVATSDLGLDPADVDPDGPLGDVLLDHSDLLVRLGRDWVRIRRAARGVHRPDPPGEETVLAAAPGPDPDIPAVARHVVPGVLGVSGSPRYRYLPRGPWSAPEGAVRSHRHLLGADAVAVGTPTGWFLADLLAGSLSTAEAEPLPVLVPPEEEVLGPARVAADDVRLVTRSPVGLLLRGPSGVTPAVRPAGVAGDAVVHPVLPLVAAAETDGTVVVRHLVTGEELQRLAQAAG